MREIRLTKGKSSIVDDEHFDELTKHRWYYSGKYARRDVFHADGRREYVWMHRVVANTPQGMDTDHINGNKLDNRRANLRICTRSQNIHNIGKRRQSGISRYKGVTYACDRVDKWGARVCLGNKRVVIGFFATEREAAIAYNEAARRMVGEFAQLNEIN